MRLTAYLDNADEEGAPKIVVLPTKCWRGFDSGRDRETDKYGHESRHCEQEPKYEVVTVENQEHICLFQRGGASLSGRRSEQQDQASGEPWAHDDPRSGAATHQVVINAHDEVAIGASHSSPKLATRLHIQVRNRPLTAEANR
jgi:hypothetical protein